MDLERAIHATHFGLIAMRAQKQRAELEKAVTKLSDDDVRARSELEHAIAAVDELLAGSLEFLTEATVDRLSRWMAETKHLLETTKPQRGPAH